MSNTKYHRIRRKLIENGEWNFRNFRSPRYDIDYYEKFIDRNDRGPFGTCWEWILTPSSAGYGRASTKTGRKPAHRVLYELYIESVPDDMDLDHLCRNRLCVNPAHLEPVTRKENLLRGNTIVRINASKTHCIRGHPFDEENTYITKAGHRHCKACNKLLKLVRKQTKEE